MKLRPGPNMARLGLALLLAAVASFFVPAAAWVIPVALVPAALLFALDYVDLRRSMDHLSVSRALPASVGRDIPFQVELKITNSGRRTLAGEVRDVLPDAAEPAYWVAQGLFAPGTTATRFARTLRIAVRGLHRFGPVWVRVHGRFALLEAQRRFDVPGAVKVLPEGLHSAQELRKEAADEIRLLDKLTHTRLQGAGTEFESLREYRFGDDPRRIDWRATACHARPIVRRFQIERHRDVMIVIDSGRLMGAQAGKGTKLDCAVDAALMLSRVALEGGDRCGLGVFDDQVQGYLPPQSGPGAMRPLTDSVYNVQSRWHESNFTLMFATLQARQSKRSLVVILSDLVDEQTSQRFRAALASLSRRHVVLFAALKTPLLGQLVTAPLTNMLDGARKAVTFRILRQRERALHTLHAAGIHVMDVEPSELTVPLLNYYIDLRQRNLL